MSAKSLRLSFVCFALAGALAACGKKEAPPEESADKPKEESTEAATKEAPDAASEEHAADAASTEKEDISDLAKRRRDRLNRRPSPRPHEADAGESADGAEGALGGDRPVKKDLKDPKDLKTVDVAAAPPIEKKPGAEGTNEPTPTDPSVDPSIVGEGKVDPLGEHKSGATPVPAMPGTNPKDLASHGTTQPLDATRLMPLQSVLDLTEAKGLIDAGVLPGIATGQGYVSVLYKGTSADKFGVSLQAWQDPARRESDDRFRRMRLQYPNAEDVQVLQPAKAFFAHFSGIQMLTFVDSVKRVVATVACAEAICTHDQLTKLAKAVRERL